MSVQAQFDKAVLIVKNLPKEGPVQPTQEDQLKFYAHFKQATVGDCNAPAPGMFDFVGKAKYKAWQELKGKVSQEEAKEKYVALLLDILNKADDEESKKHIAELEAAKTA